MQNESNEMRRRDFLRLSGASVAAAGLRTLLPAADGQTAEPTGTRSAPAHPVVLESDELEVTLDGDDGLPYEYKWQANGARLRGENFGLKISATICDRAAWRFFNASLDCALSHGLYAAEGAVASAGIFDFRAKDGAKDCATFQISYELQDASLRISMLDVKELNGYELIDVAMPRLVTVREQDGPAWLVHGDSGGHFVMLADATAGAPAPNSFWGRINGQLPVNMVGTDHLICVQETTAFMDTTEVEVTGTAGSRRAAIGSGRVHRVNGHDCYNLNLGAGAPLNCGNAATPNLLVEDMENISSCRLDFLPGTGDPQADWIKAGKLIRDRTSAMPNSFYHDKYMYGIRCDEPRFPQPMSAFAQCEQMIAEIAELIDGTPQIVHLWGWQFKGKDTGYPAVNVVNERIGGYDGMMELMEHGRAHNATVTLSDNYDDAYKSSPAWDEAMIARRPDGDFGRAALGRAKFRLSRDWPSIWRTGRGTRALHLRALQAAADGAHRRAVLLRYSQRLGSEASSERNSQFAPGSLPRAGGVCTHGVDVTSEGIALSDDRQNQLLLVRADVGDKPVWRQAGSAAAAGLWQERNLGAEWQHAGRCL